MRQISTHNQNSFKFANKIGNQMLRFLILCNGNKCFFQKYLQIGYSIVRSLKVFSFVRIQTSFYKILTFNKKNMRVLQIDTLKNTYANCIHHIPMITFHRTRCK